MAETTVASGLKEQVWDNDFFKEYVRASRFNPYMGTEHNSIIVLNEDLTKKAGDRVTFSAMRKLSAAGVTGSQTLVGNEEALDNRSLAVTVDWIRHGVTLPKREQQYTGIEMRAAAKAALKDWSMEKLRDQIVAALASIDGVAYTSATATQKNSWEANNADRILMGALNSNRTGTHATSLSNIDNTDDKLSPAIISLAKRIAMASSPKIKPIRVDGDKEFYVMFAGPRPFRDLQNNTVMTQANRDARDRGVNTNPIFQGGELIWDGVVIIEIPEIATVSSTIVVSPNYLCGQGAVGIGWAQRMKSTTKNEDDYGFKPGIGIEECRGIEKLRFGTSASADTTTPVDNGVVTVFTAAVADA